MADNSMKIETLLELDKQTMEYLKDIRDTLLKSSSNNKKQGGSRITTSSRNKSGNFDDFNKSLDNLNKVAEKTGDTFEKYNDILNSSIERLRKNQSIESLKTQKKNLESRASDYQKSFVGGMLSSRKTLFRSLNANAEHNKDVYDSLNTEGKKLENERFDLDKALKLAKTDDEKKNILEKISSKDKQISDNNKLLKTASRNVLISSAKIGAYKDLANLPDKIFTKVQAFYKVLGIDLKNTFKDITDNIREAFGKQGIASYNLGSSLFTNASARESAFKFGLSSSQNYALTKTRGLLNLQSDEDLMYMNKDQKEYFNQLMKKYGDWYTKLESSGVFRSVQEMQLEFEMFKQEISYTLLEWFAENKELIMTVLKGSLEVFEKILKVVTKIASKIKVKGLGSDSASASDNLSVIQSAKNATYNINTNSTNNISTGINSTQDLVNAMDSSNSNYLKGLMVAVNSFD